LKSIKITIVNLQLDIMKGKTKRGERMNSREKWDNKHEERLNQFKEPVPNERLKNLASYLKGEAAIDLASGLGGNSLFLAGMGYEVQAFDLSETAVKYVREQAGRLGLKVDVFVKDLTEFDSLPFKEASFDLAVITYYLDRSLLAFVKGIIKEKGFFFMETYYSSPKAEIHKVSSQFRLESNELLREFQPWKILYFEENENEGRQTIFCQKLSDI
jgi:tellurite methyltransferase